METEIISLRSCLDSPLNDPWPSSDSSFSLPASPTTYRNSNKFSCLLSSSLSLSFPFLYLRPSPFAAVFLFKLVWGCSSLSLAWRDRDLKPAASEEFDSSTASSSRSTELQDIMSLKDANTHFLMFVYVLARQQKTAFSQLLIPS